jgi:hypothetical protein
MKKVLEYAAMITENSPDSVIISREGINLGWEGVGAEEAAISAGGLGKTAD